MDFLKGLISFIAALGMGGWINEWRRGRREDRLRWHGERRAAYERFLTGTNTLRDTGLEIAEWRGNLRAYTDWGDDPVFTEESLLREAEKLDDPHWARFGAAKIRELRPIFDQAGDQIQASLVSIEMLANKSVQHLAQIVYHAIYELYHTADEYPPRECGGWSQPLAEASDKFDMVRQTFIDAARKELGISQSRLISRPGSRHGSISQIA